MAYLYIENFESGLDTRKSAFTAPPGSLRVAKNVHITRGKEIARRKAFPVIATLPSNTFGLHVAQGKRYVFGSVDGGTLVDLPPKFVYQRLQAPDDPAMTAILDTQNFAGKIYAVAEFDDGSVHHYYDGVLVADWETIAANLLDEAAVLRALARKMATDERITVELAGSEMYIEQTIPDGSMFLASSGISNYIEIQSFQAAQAAVDATASFDVTGGSTGPTFNTIVRVKVGDAELLGGSLDYDTDNATTAANIAVRINAGNSGFSASSSGATVTITAPVGSGATYNGDTLTVDVAGDVTVGSLNDMSGGQAAQAAVPTIWRVRQTNTNSASYLLQVSSTGDSRDYRVLGDTAAMPRTIRAFKQKMYAVTGSLLYFSGFADGTADPTKWVNGGSSPTITGAGFINMATQDSGSEDLIGIGVYQNRIAVFSNNSVQIWNVDPDPAQNSIYQVLLNIGAVAPASIVEYGDLDLFFLADSGVRSLRARDSSNLAAANDVGVAIDNELTEFMSNIGTPQVLGAKAVVEPIDSRYLLAIQDRIYVLSNFPGSKVSAWTTYEIGQPVDSWAIKDRYLLMRTGDDVRQYGGLTGNEYDADTAEVWLPFLDASNPAGEKQLSGVDMGAQGVWRLDMATEPDAPDETVLLGFTNGATYGSRQRFPAEAQSTHFALRLRSDKPEAALIGNAIIHYQDMEAD